MNELLTDVATMAKGFWRGRDLGDGTAVPGLFLQEQQDPLRENVAVADLLPEPTFDAVAIEGQGVISGLPSGTYYVGIVAVNAYGRSPRKVKAVVLAGNDDAIKVELDPLAQGFGKETITHFDIYCSTDSDPKFLTRVSVNNIEQGWAIYEDGGLDTEFPEPDFAPGVGLAAVGEGIQGANVAEPTGAVLPPALDDDQGGLSPGVIDCRGAQFVDFDLMFVPDGPATPELVVIPYFWNYRADSWFQGEEAVVAFGGTTGNRGAYRQRFRVEARGASAMFPAVAKISGGKLFVWASLS